MYKDIHRFLEAREWAKAPFYTGTAGIIWMEMFILYDATGGRDPKSEYVKNREAKQRAEGRQSKDKAKRRKKNPRSNFAIIKPTLQEEITLFKRIVRQIAKHEMDEEKSGWFQVEERTHLRRLASLGVLAHQPAIKAITKTTDDEKDILVRSIMAQKAGHCTKAGKLYEDYKKWDKEEGDPPNVIKIKKAKIAMMAPVKWKRRIVETQTAEEGAAAEDANHQGSPGQKGYRSRSIQCTRCGSFQETWKMQLHTPQGYRDIHCKACGKHERCLKN